MQPLTNMSTREDLTDKECARIIGGLIGSLLTMTNEETVRSAVRWWAENDGAWGGFRLNTPLMHMSAFLAGLK